MSWRSFWMDPLEGNTSLSRVVWGYGLLGSLLYGALELFIDSGNATMMRAYSLGGVLLSVYVTVATYRCADNCRSTMLARLARLGAVLTLILLPLLVYWDWTGGLDAALNALVGGSLE